MQQDVICRSRSMQKGVLSADCLNCIYAEGRNIGPVASPGIRYISLFLFLLSFFSNVDMGEDINIFLGVLTKTTVLASF